MYSVVVRGWPYVFDHRDSFLRFIEVMKERGEDVGARTMGIIHSCDEGVRTFEQICEGETMARQEEEDIAVNLALAMIRAKTPEEYKKAKRAFEEHDLRMFEKRMNLG
jgi:hypothetical protein